MSDKKAESWQFHQSEVVKYDQVSAAVSGYRRSAEITADLIKDKFAGKQPEYWLDLGTGTGNSLVDILKHGVKPKTAIGLDKSSSWLTAASAKIKQLEFKPGLINADGLKLPFANESLDCISAIQAMHWMMLKSSPEATFAELNRVLKPGGLLVFDESAYHLKFDPVVNYLVSTIDQQGKRRLGHLTGSELSQRWFFESVGDLVLRGLMENKTMAEVYKDKNGFHGFTIPQLTEALTVNSFKTETSKSLLLYKREEMRASLAYDYKTFMSIKREDLASQKIGIILNAIDDSKLRNKGEILVHWAAKKS